jgi:type IV secretory pathway VirJ component
MSRRRVSWIPWVVLAFSVGVSNARSASMVSELPLIQRPVEGEQATFVVLFSGDGGWSTLTREISQDLNERGYSVVGWNTLKYFWSPKPPDAAADDLGRVIEHFAAAWRKVDVVLAGYSMGASVLPAIVNRLLPGTRARVRSLVLLAPDRVTDFEVHVSGWLHLAPHGEPVERDLEGLTGTLPIACVYGIDEAEQSLCPLLRGPRVTVTRLPGAHHFDGNYTALARLVI